MHLWQIRHIPNRPQTLLKLTFLVTSLAAIVVTLIAPMGFALAQPADGGTAKAETDSKEAVATEFLNQVRQELQKHQSVKADLVQNVSIGDQQFKISGQYLSSGNTESGTKLKLSYWMTPDQGVQGEMLEVCDGIELWTMLKLPESKRVTRRNILQIQKAAAAAVQRNVPESTLNVELGLGGLTALLASLERTMVFDAMKQDSADGHKRTIIQGRWKKELAQRFPKEKDDILPAFVPDLVRLYINNDMFFPERLLYLKKQPEKKTLKPLVSLEFQNIELDGPVDDTSFVFDVPNDVIPEDITKLYLDRFATPADPAPAQKKE